MQKQVKFPLSYYFDELRRQKNGNTMNESSATTEQQVMNESSGNPVRSSATATISVLKALKMAKDHTLTFMALAKSAKLKLDPCQEALAQLSSEELVEIEPDSDTGNDRIKLTQKGAELV